MNDQKLLALVKKAMRDDRVAFTMLYEMKSREVMYLCTRELENEQDGQDAAQEVFVHIMNRIGKLRSPHAFNVWLNRIIISTCNKMRRTDMKQNVVALEDSVLHSIPDGAEDSLPQAFLENEDSRKMMVRLVDALPDTYRRCVLLHYYQKMSYADIAAVLEITTDAVNNNLRMARKVLKREVENSYGGSAKLYSVGPLVAFGPAMSFIFTKSAESTITEEMLVGAAVGWKTAMAAIPAKPAGMSALAKAGLTAAAITAAAGITISVASFFTPSTPHASSSPGQSAVAGQPQSRQAGLAQGEDGVEAIVPPVMIPLAAQAVIYHGGAMENQPLAGLTIIATPVNEEESTAGGESLYFVSGDDGRFGSALLPEGRYRLTVELPEGAVLMDAGGYSKTEIYSIEKGNTLAGLFFVVNMPAVVEGRLRFQGEVDTASFAEGRIAMALLSLNGEVLATTAINAQGVFCFDGLLLEGAANYILRVVDEENALGYTVEDYPLYLYPGCEMLLG